SAPAGEPRIEVTFDIDTEGMVHVSAKDLESDKEQSITVEGPGLSDEELKRAADRNEARATA
ncbi:MAG: Hsp70 family protein, partial [Bradymonadaceae bacterium]